VAGAAIRNFRIGPSLSNLIESGRPIRIRIESRSFAGPYWKAIPRYVSCRSRVVQRIRKVGSWSFHQKTDGNLSVYKSVCDIYRYVQAAMSTYCLEASPCMNRIHVTGSSVSRERSTSSYMHSSASEWYSYTQIHYRQLTTAVHSDNSRSVITGTVPVTGSSRICDKAAACLLFDFGVVQSRQHNGWWLWTTDSERRIRFITADDTGGRQQSPRLTTLCGLTVYKILSTLNRTSPGIDGVPYWVHKYCAIELAPVLTNLINTILNNGTPPSTWLKVLVTPVPKKTPPTDFCHLRRISVTPIMSRVTDHGRLYNIQASMHWSTYCPQILAASLAYWPNLWPLIVLIVNFFFGDNPPWSSFIPSTPSQNQCTLSLQSQ